MAEAIRDLVEDPFTGSLRVMFKDAVTGIEIPIGSILDYDIVAPTDQGTLAPVNAEFGNPVIPPILPQQTEVPEQNSQGGNGTTLQGSDAPRTQANNFGYVNKPGIMGITNMAPGPIGLASRMANGMVNANNTQATSAARQSIGLSPSVDSFGDVAKGAFKDNKGQVADVNMNGQTYSVSLEATAPDGRTALTPNEARNRGLTAPTGMAEATPEESAQNAKDSGVARQGLLGRAVGFGRETLGKVSSAITPTVSNPLATPSVASVGPSIRESSVAPSTIGIPASAPVSRSTLSPTTPSVSAPAVAGLGFGTTASPVGTNVRNYSTLTRAASQIAPSVPNPTARPSVPSFDSLTKQRDAMATAPAPTARSAPSLNPIGSNPLNQTPSMPGLSGISNNFKAGTFGTIESMDRANLSPSISRAMDKIGEALGPGVGINSGYRDPNKNASVNGASKSQHIQGKAVDINVAGWTDQQKTAALEAAAESGVKGVGIYNSGTSLHVDTRPADRLSTWGPSPEGAYTGVSIDAQPSWARETLTAIDDAGPFNVGPKVGPTPTPRDNALATPARADIADANARAANLKGLVNTDISTVSAGKLANAGVSMDFSDEDVSRMAKTLGGELTPSTLRGLARQDPTAIAEAAAIVSTMTNRMQTEPNVATMTRASQYNANMTSPLKNGTVPAEATARNYNKYGEALEGVTRQALSGLAQSPAPEATHYANRDVAKKQSYDDSMTNVTKVNSHTFGTVTDNGRYSSKKSTAAQQQEAMAKANVATISASMGVQAADQRADRQPTRSATAPTTGLGSSVSAAASAASAKSSADKSASKSASDRASDSKSGSGSGSDKSSSSGSKGSGSTSSSSSASSSKSSSSSSGKGVGSSPSSSSSKGSSSSGKSSSGGSSKGSSSSKSGGSNSSKSDSSGAKGSAGARS